jgi:uncharacterized protein YkwD
VTLLTLNPSRPARVLLALGLAILALSPVACRESAGPTAPKTSSPAPPAPAPGPTDPIVAELVTLVNQHRASLGLVQLQWDSRVAAVAQAHSQDMVDRSFFSHTNPDGETPWDRLAAAGVTYTYAGENIAYGYPTAASVFQAWMNSSGHRANIENPNFTHHGVGLVGTYWTHDFIRPTSSSAAPTP